MFCLVGLNPLIIGKVRITAVEFAKMAFKGHGEALYFFGD
jgi:hypothetical protein